ncbi:MAG: hypothetical protein EOO43_01660 [Flavobacterium sp.]|nr:MAG: hypothetical protein EOO43_01660 [Flavobacterium sp.]
MEANLITLAGFLRGIFSFSWIIIQYIDTRNREQNLREFEHFHKLLKELVQPEDDKGTMYIDRQTAIIYELRHFRRYYPYSLRTLKGLLEKWKKVPDQYPRILEDANLTILYLESKVKS